MLGAVAPTAGTQTVAANIPSGSVATVTRVLIVNRGASADTYRVAISVLNDTTVATAEWIAYDEPISGNSHEYVDIYDDVVGNYSIVVESGSTGGGNLGFTVLGSQVETV